MVVKPDAKPVQVSLGGGWYVIGSMNRDLLSGGAALSGVQLSQHWNDRYSTVTSSLAVVEGTMPHFDWDRGCVQVHQKFTMRVCVAQGPSSGEAYVALLRYADTAVDLRALSFPAGNRRVELTVLIHPEGGALLYSFDVILVIEVDPATNGYLVRMTWGAGVIKYTQKLNVPFLFKQKTIGTVM